MGKPEQGPGPRLLKVTYRKTRQATVIADEGCYFCSRGILQEKRVTVDFRWGKRLVIIENVPARVCNECGERYYAARVVRQMEQVAKKGRREKELRVPVVTLA
jgi:YgiT-type zinc finger domain-containing protein